MHRMSRLVAIAMLAMTALVLSAPSAPSAIAVDADEEEQNCAAFITQVEAQAWFMSHGGSKTNNVDFLDADHDGIACEHLGSTSGDAPATKEEDGFPWVRVMPGVIALAVLGGVGGAAVTVLRKRQAADAGTTPLVTVPMGMPEPIPTEIPCDPPPPGWPIVTEARAAELAAMPDATYRTTPEWLQRADSVLLVTGGRCQLCSADLMLPEDVRHRTTERRGQESPCDLIVLCGRCAAQLGIATNET